VSGQYGQTSSKEIDYNDALKQNFQNALLVNPTPGNCYVGGSCVPVNIFAGPGGINPAAVKLFRRKSPSRYFGPADGPASFDHGRSLPLGRPVALGQESVSVAIGAEYRQERASLVPDYNTATGISGYEAQTLTQGQFDVAEGSPNC